MGGGEGGGLVGVRKGGIRGCEERGVCEGVLSREGVLSSQGCVLLQHNRVYYHKIVCVISVMPPHTCS